MNLSIRSWVCYQYTCSEQAMKAISLKTTAIDLVGLAQTGVEYILMVRLTLGACHTPTESCVVSHRTALD